MGACPCHHTVHRRPLAETQHLYSGGDVLNLLQTASWKPPSPPSLASPFVHSRHLL